MQETAEAEMPICPLDSTIHVLAGKWKSIIICHLIKGPARFSQLNRALPRCTRRMLSLQLNQLEKDRIVQKSIYAETVPIKTEYSLTEIGETLVPIVLAMNQWGKTYLNSLQHAVCD
ncbi:MAG: helix-turn-helix transcriptional regulator [Sporolactobacillus sp.]|jgi:DNA-binding HxlR family transcriptional regulator|nr:helix-turn-helix transcriptional regulator [Sporolactobacillus sp.]MCI1882912.1 helix-turn-helix transcriptional regulator [Sporolactobacillus sp.]